MKSVSKEDHPDFIGGVVWSRLELDWIRARDFKWESIVAEQRGTITALNIALGGEGSTSTENLVDAHDLDIGDAGLIALCRKLIAEAAATNETAEALARSVMADHVSNDSHALFIAAVRDLAAISEHLDCDPDDGGAVPIIEAIDELKGRIAALEQDAARYLDALTRISQVPPDTCTTAYDMRYIARKTVSTPQ